MHSSDEEEADALINSPSAPVDDNVIDDNITVDFIINEDYCEDETIPHLPPIHSKLSELLTKWLHNAPSREKIKDLFKQCMLPNGWVSNIFLVPKCQGGFRMILHLKELNKFVKYTKFKMDHVDKVISLL